MSASEVDREAEVRRLAAQLEAAQEELAAFAFSVSHDLRAPLRAITGFSEALAEDYAEKLDAEGLDYLQRIRDAASHMDEAIVALTELSRVARADLRIDSFDVSAAADAIGVELTASDPSREVEFSVERGLVVRADPALMTLCLRHLLDNAWKFTSKHPSARISVKSEPHENRRVLAVCDDGAGFDSGSQGRLFGAFQRLHRTSDFPGLGMGLAIVRRIVHRHGGRVWATGHIESGAAVYIDLG